MPANRSIHRSPAIRGGFSFVEILFAVMILGIGFIMVAAVFPVAIQQTATTAQEVSAAELARAGASTVNRLAETITPAVSLDPAAPFKLPATFLASTNAAQDEKTAVEASTAVFQGKGQTSVAGHVVSFRSDMFAGATPQNSISGLAMWRAVAGNLILPSNRRYAWTPLYRRDLVYHPPVSGAPAGTWSPAPYAQLIIIGLQVRNRAAYETDKDLLRFDAPQQVKAHYPATLEPQPVLFSLSPPAGGAGSAASVTFTGGPSLLLNAYCTNAPGDAGHAVEGAYLVMAESDTAGGVLGDHSLNGHVYRLGAESAASGSNRRFELAPGGDLGAQDLASLRGATRLNCVGYLIGRGLENPTVTNSGSTGTAQDITVYTTFMKVNDQ